jgi:N-acetylglucosaminyldiphosphoundecaprenol N-acetyl-beta-D-mannosaminyltransferase
MRDFPGASIAGVESPRFGEISDDDVTRAGADIVQSGAQIVWVGLGMPKQELWMARAHPHLPGVTLVGVGAAFDWMAGTKQMAPQWMRDRGLEWLYRLSTEPRRMWRRYAYNNPAFLLLLTRRWLGTAVRGLIESRRRRP